MSKKLGDWYHYVGAMHIHTTESDGTKTLEEVVALGRQVGLEFMIFSDHMNLNNKSKEGFYGDTLVTVGYEHNDANDTHHYLLFDTPTVYPSEMTPHEYVAAGAADGALGIMAHPDEIRDKLKEFPPYPWHDWTVEGYTGVELWNQMSEWMEKLTRFNKLAMSLSPRKSMVGPSDRILKKWDELNMKRKVVGTAGVDAHAFPVKLGPWTVQIFPYKVHFKTLKLFVILPEPMSKDFRTASEQLYEAIRDCRVYFANLKWGNVEALEFYAFNSSEKAVCGGRLSSCEDARIVARLPSRATIRLIHNGQKILETNSDRLEYVVSTPGIYRLEAWKGRRGWIFSNHIRVVC